MKKIVIIGGGILGAATAYELSKSGAKVTIIDREDLGQATKAAAGIICPWVSQRRNKRWYLLAKEGAKYYPQLMEELRLLEEEATGYQKVGALCLHSDQLKLKAMEERTLLRKQEAPEIGDVSILSPKEAKQLFPPLAEGYAALHVSGAARVNGWELRNALLRASQKLGTEFIQDDCSLMWEGNQILGVSTNTKKIAADETIIAGGVWVNQLLKSLPISFPVSSQRGQIIHLQLPNVICKDWPVIMPPHDQYILSLSDNRLVIGATHENEVGNDYRVTLNGIKEIIDKALIFAPGLSESTFLEAKIGFRPFTADFLPVFGRVTNVKGLIIANGLGASGLTMGPFIGQQLAKLILDLNVDINFANYSLDENKEK